MHILFVGKHLNHHQLLKPFFSKYHLLSTVIDSSYSQISIALSITKILFIVHTTIYLILSFKSLLSLPVAYPLSPYTFSNPDANTDTSDSPGDRLTHNFFSDMRRDIPSPFLPHSYSSDLLRPSCQFSNLFPTPFPRCV